jgi:hypothetical protein
MGPWAQGAECGGPAGGSGWLVEGGSGGRADGSGGQVRTSGWAESSVSIFIVSDSVKQATFCRHSVSDQCVSCQYGSVYVYIYM